MEGSRGVQNVTVTISGTVDLEELNKAGQMQGKRVTAAEGSATEGLKGGEKADRNDSDTQVRPLFSRAVTRQKPENKQLTRVKKGKAFSSENGSKAKRVVTKQLNKFKNFVKGENFKPISTTVLPKHLTTEKNTALLDKMNKHNEDVDKLAELMEKMNDLKVKNDEFKKEYRPVLEMLDEKKAWTKKEAENKEIQLEIPGDSPDKVTIVTIPKRELGQKAAREDAIKDAKESLSNHPEFRQYIQNSAQISELKAEMKALKKEMKENAAEIKEGRKQAIKERKAEIKENVKALVNDKYKEKKAGAEADLQKVVQQHEKEVEKMTKALEKNKSELKELKKTEKLEKEKKDKMSDLIKIENKEKDLAGDWNSSHNTELTQDSSISEVEKRIEAHKKVKQQAKLGMKSAAIQVDELKTDRKKAKKALKDLQSNDPGKKEAKKLADIEKELKKEITKQKKQLLKDFAKDLKATESKTATKTEVESPKTEGNDGANPDQ